MNIESRYIGGIQNIDRRNSSSFGKASPSRKSVDLQPMTQCIPFKHTTGEAVCKAIKSFPKGTAAGPSGLRAAHIQEALLSASDDTTDLCIDALTQFVDLCIQEDPLVARLVSTRLCGSQNKGVIADCSNSLPKVKTVVVSVSQMTTSNACLSS